jgi:hypothetical protein
MRESDIIPTTENTQETERVETDDMSITAAGGWTVPSEMVYEDNIPVRDIPDPLARLHQLADGSIRFEHEPEDRDPETQIAHGPRFQWSLPQAFGPDPTDEELASAQERRANAIMAAREALAARNLAGQTAPAAGDLIRVAEWISGESHYRAWHQGQGGGTCPYPSPVDGTVW